MDSSRTMKRKGLTRARRFALAALSGSLLLTACTSVHTTSEGAIGLKRRQMMSPLVSEAQLDQSAQVAYAEVLQKAKSEGGLNTDPAMTARVRAVAGRIIPQVGAFRQDALKWQWQVNVIKSDELNAWCMPGGKIAFYSGIIQQLNLTDDPGRGGAPETELVALAEHAESLPHLRVRGVMAVAPLDVEPAAAFARVAEHRGRRRVARDHEQLHAGVHEVVHDPQGIGAHLGDRQGPVGAVRGVTDVEDLLVGQLVDDRPGHRQPAEARVEDADRLGAPAHSGAPPTRAWVSDSCSQVRKS